MPNRKKRKQLAQATGTEEPKEYDGKKKCAACLERKEECGYSRNQLTKEANKRRCKECILVDRCISRDGVTPSVVTTKKAKLNSSTATTKAAAPARSMATACCKACQKTKKVTHFPGDYSSDASSQSSAYCCVECIFDRQPRSCQDCKKAKPKNEYSSAEWKRHFDSWKGGTLQGKKTARDVEVMARKVGRQVCLKCETIREEKAAEAQRDKERRIREVMRKHRVEYYDYDSALPPLEYSETKPQELKGEYDIVFHVGRIHSSSWNYEEVFENRTTKGTVILKEEPKEEEVNTIDEDQSDDDERSGEEDEEEGTLFVSGTVKFHEDMEHLASNLIFQRDVSLWKGRHKTGYDNSWQCELRARLTNQEAGPCFYKETKPGYLNCIKKRAALPWIKYEHPAENKEEEENKEESKNDKDVKRVQFDTLEQAEALARQHEEGHDVSNWWLTRHLNVPKVDIPKEVIQRIHLFLFPNPCPVFFLEPGDLELQVEWSEDEDERDGGRAFTVYILRKRAT